GRLHKTLAEKHLGDVAKKVQIAVEKTARERTFQELIISDVLELGLATENDKQLLEMWATERNLKVGEFIGPSYDADEIARMDLKFKDEQKQLPRGNPNVLIIWNNSVFFQSHEVKSIINKLEEIVYKYPHLLLGIIAGGYMGLSETAVIMKDQHAF